MRVQSLEVPTFLGSSRMKEAELVSKSGGYANVRVQAKLEIGSAPKPMASRTLDTTERGEIESKATAAGGGGGRHAATAVAVSPLSRAPLHPPYPSHPREERRPQLRHPTLHPAAEDMAVPMMDTTSESEEGEEAEEA